MIKTLGSNPLFKKRKIVFPPRCIQNDPPLGIYVTVIRKIKTQFSIYKYIQNRPCILFTFLYLQLFILLTRFQRISLKVSKQSSELAGTIKPRKQYTHLKF
jgi:hypothetical protein